MRKLLMTAIVMTLYVMAAKAKTLVVYYSYTNNVHTIVNDLRTQIDADVVRIEPAEKGLDYSANGYAIGSAQIAAIRRNPNDASSYPAIDPVTIDMDDYDVVIVAAPLWWSNMASPMQSFLFQYGGQMAGKRIGLIVSSASSGINGVVADARRLVPLGGFMSQNLWVRSSEVSKCHGMIKQWLEDVGYKNEITGVSAAHATVEDNSVALSDYGVSVGGVFDSMAVFDAGGRKLIETSSPFTAFRFGKGCYIARLGKGGDVRTVRLFLR